MDSSTFVGQNRLKINHYEQVFLSNVSTKKGFFSKVLNKWYSFLHALKIFKMVANNEYDFVQVRDKVFIALIVLIATRRKKIPFYYWLSFPHVEADVIRSYDDHGLPLLKRAFFYVRGKISGFILYRIVLLNADFVFVQSTKMLEDLTKKGLQPERMMPVPMGVNLDNIRLSSEWVIPSDLKSKEVLVYLGTMVYERRIDFLLEMLPKVLARFPDVILLLVGDASDKEMNFLKQRALELGIQKSVYFTGFVPMAEAWAYVKNAKIGLSPFKPCLILDSTSPTKLVEYMACSIPVVANTHPDQSEVINKSGAGFAVDYTPEAFSEACITILSDPEKAKSMGEAGVLYVEKNRVYSSLSTKLERKYLQLLETFAGE